MAGPYVPPEVWQWQPVTGAGQVASTNRPMSGATHDGDLPRGSHPFQLYSLASQNGQKTTIMFEELLEAGHTDANMTPGSSTSETGLSFQRLCRGQSEQQDPLHDRPSGESLSACSNPARSSCIWPRNSAHSFPAIAQGRAECLSWLFWQVGSAPSIGGGFGHFFRCAEKQEYPDQPLRHGNQAVVPCGGYRLASNRFLAGDDYTIADIAAFPWFAGLIEDHYGARAFLAMDEYENSGEMGRRNPRPSGGAAGPIDQFLD